MKCHFVYAVPQPAKKLLFKWARRKFFAALSKLGMPVNVVTNRQPMEKELASWPVRSPYENTHNIYNALSRYMPTYLYLSTERVCCDLSPSDVFLGHPFFPISKKSRGVTEIAARSPIRPRKFALITPLHCDTSIQTTHFNKAFLDHVDNLLQYADVLFGIMGE